MSSESNACKPKKLFDQHKNPDCVRKQAHMTQGDVIPTTWKDALDCNYRTYVVTCGILASSNSIKQEKIFLPGIENITDKLIEFEICERLPSHHWRGLQYSKSSLGSLKCSHSVENLKELEFYEIPDLNAEGEDDLDIKNNIEQVQKICRICMRMELVEKCQVGSRCGHRWSIFVRT